MEINYNPDVVVMSRDVFDSLWAKYNNQLSGLPRRHGVASVADHVISINAQLKKEADEEEQRRKKIQKFWRDRIDMIRFRLGQKAYYRMSRIGNALDIVELIASDEENPGWFVIKNLTRLDDPHPSRTGSTVNTVPCDMLFFPGEEFEVYESRVKPEAGAKTLPEFTDPPVTFRPEMSDLSEEVSKSLRYSGRSFVSPNDPVV